MTQEEKELLIKVKDLCARLPYHLLGRDVFGKIREMKVIYPTGTIIAQEIDGENCSSCGFIPYLRPMSSMTEEEFDEIKRRWVFTEDCRDENDLMDVINRGTIDTFDAYSFIDWLNAHHFDYKGLIKKGLALEAPEEMYNTKTE